MSKDRQHIHYSMINGFVQRVRQAAYAVEKRATDGDAIEWEHMNYLAGELKSLADDAARMRDELRPVGTTAKKKSDAP